MQVEHATNQRHAWWLCPAIAIACALVGYSASALTPVFSSLLALIAFGLAFAAAWWLTRDKTQTELPAAKEDQHLSAMTEVAEVGDQVAISAAELSHLVDKLRQVLSSQTEQATLVAASAQQISDTTHSMADSARQAEQSASGTRNHAATGSQAVQQASVLIGHVNLQMSEAVETVNQLASRTREIQRVTEMINGVAEQTNLLALNAAIEAARAGDAGRGFAVVADEVRGLANQTAKATDEIGSLLNDVDSGATAAVDHIHSLQSQIVDVVGVTETVDQSLSAIEQEAVEADQRVSEIASAIDEHAEVSGQISQSIHQMHDQLEQLGSDSGASAEQAQKLTETAEQIFHVLGSFDLQTKHSVMCQLVMETAKQIGDLFSQQVELGTINAQGFFDTAFKAVPGTNPTKFTTQYDKLCDQLLPDVQEALLSRFPQLDYAICSGPGGYVPTHNKRYCQPLTGDYQTDLVNNRTKRVYDNRNMLYGIANTKPFLLMTYKRETGQTLHDLTAPIYINGRHWGCFRVGYSAD